MQFRGRRVHFVGIGGAGLSAIARVLMEQGAEVSGSDLVLSPVAQALARDGASVFAGHRMENVAGAELVIVSSAVPVSNAEVQAAQAAGIPVLKRPEFLAQMMDSQVGVAVAGTHGKTTTTAMIASILLEAGHDPTFIVGGVIAGLETNARAGGGALFVIEADEYDRTFLSLRPKVAVVTNVEHDHPDCYPTFADFRAAFDEFAALVPPDGLLVACWDDPVARDLGQRQQAAGAAVTFFGLREGAEWRAEDVRPNFAGGVDFLATREGEVLGLVRLRLPGAHNASNAMAALAVADFLDVPFGAARSALTEFRGVGRRFEIKGEVDGVAVVDDYAHHPTEIRATLQAARDRFPKRSLWAVWQPHTYSRTKTLMSEFARAFGVADHVIVLPIYPARETDTLGISSADVTETMQHSDVRCAGSLDEAAVWLGTEVRPGDVVLTLGAGDGDRVGEWLLEVLGMTMDVSPGVDALAAALGPQARRGEPLSRYTAMRVGGPAEILVVCESVDEVIRAIELARRHGVDWRVLGGGCNVLVADRGVRGLVVVNRAARIEFAGSVARAEAGAPLAVLAREAVERGLAGLEWAAGLPGTMGGAVVGNAGAFEGDIESTLRDATVLGPDDEVVERPGEWFEFEYRGSRIKREAGRGQHVVLAATFELKPGDSELLSARVGEILEWRKTRHPSGATVGSTFKNPPGSHAGYLIEQAGLRGYRVGGAQVSELHGNFFMNAGDATAADVLALVEHVRAEVQRQFGVELELEIELVGEW